MKEQTVLFVCVHNAGRSQMAEAFTNRMAASLGLNIRGLSAGTVGGSSLNPLVVEVMDEVGISMEGQFPKLISDELVRSANKVISMGCGVDAAACPTKFLLSEDWELSDPAGQSIERVREIRDEVKAKVSLLLQDMVSK